MGARADEPVEGTASPAGSCAVAGLPAGPGLPGIGTLSPGLVIGSPHDPPHDPPPRSSRAPDEPIASVDDGVTSSFWLDLFARERNQNLARFLEAIHAVAHPGGAAVGEFTADRIAAHRGWSASMAARWVQFADEVIDRLPGLHDGLSAGWLDETTVRAFCEWTRSMPDDLARLVTLGLVAVAPGVTTSDLIDRIGSQATALDPDWARRREMAARARARVVATRTAQGTADVAVRDIPADDALAMMARLDALTHAVRAGGLARGVRIGIGAVRALVSVRLQDGTYCGYDDDTLLDALIDELPAWRDHLDPDGGPGDGPGDDGPGDGPGDDGPGDDGPGDDGPGDDGPGDDGPGDDGGPDDDGPDRPDTREAGTVADEPDADEDGERGAAGDSGQGGEEFERTSGGVRTGTAELRLRLSTALRLDDLPGKIPTWGTITAHTGRDMITRARNGDRPVEWRLVLVDSAGHPEHVLLAPPDHPGRRRTGPRADQRGPTRGRLIVELAAATTMLRVLDPAAYPEWASFLRRVRERLARLTVAQQPGGSRHPATSTLDARRRRPGRELDRWVRVRDRYCIGPMCGRAAHGNDLDHTRAWLDHGPTVAGNLGGVCRHCHRLKHEGGWRLHQPTLGRFEWRTPDGTTYAVAPRPVLEALPAPAPRADGRPRPVLDIDPAPADDTGWLDLRAPRVSVSADVPNAPPPPMTDPDSDDPPPF